MPTNEIPGTVLYLSVRHHNLGDNRIGNYGRLIRRIIITIFRVGAADEGWVMAIHPDAAMARELSEMVEAGMSIQEMAVKLFVSRDVMKRLLRECGLQSRPRPALQQHFKRAFLPDNGGYDMGLTESNDPLLDTLKFHHPHRQYTSLVMKKV